MKEITEEKYFKLLNALMRTAYKFTCKAMNQYGIDPLMNSHIFMSRSRVPCYFGNLRDTYFCIKTGTQQNKQPTPADFRTNFVVGRDVIHFQPVPCSTPYRKKVVCLYNSYTDEAPFDETKYFIDWHYVGECPHKKVASLQEEATNEIQN